MASRKQRILICTPEITDLPEGMGNAANIVSAKGGGLADISAALIHYMHEHNRNNGFELHVALPWYETIIRENAAQSAFTERDMRELVRDLHKGNVHIVRRRVFADMTDVYPQKEEDNLRIQRSLAFQHGILNDIVPRVHPHLVHVNDWMLGLVPVFGDTLGYRSLFTVHNTYSAEATMSAIDAHEIDVKPLVNKLYFRTFPGDLSSPRAMESNFHRNGVDFLASGIKNADFTNTVSQKFLEEIVDGVLPAWAVPESVRRELRAKYDVGRTQGILNGIDEEIDPQLAINIRNFTDDDVQEGKALNKQLLQQECNLDHTEGPVMVWTHRLYEQKGASIFLDALPRILNAGVQVVIVGKGDSDVEQKIRSYQTTHSGQISLQPFSEPKEMLAYAGGDCLIMPSLYEPCGLAQMKAWRFGTLVAARRTGGLTETVSDLSADGRSGNGFTFDDYSADALTGAVLSAAQYFRETTLDTITGVRQRVMAESETRFSMERPAEEYMQLYHKILDGPQAP